RRVVWARGLAGPCGGVFAPPRPLWFGLWVSSPLSEQQIEVMDLVLTDLAAVQASVAKSLGGLLAALRAARRHGLPLHVRMPPPGHRDFGLSTVFAHCPRCKADVDRKNHWREVAAPARCPVCRYEGPMVPRSVTEDADEPAREQGAAVTDEELRPVQRAYLKRA